MKLIVLKAISLCLCIFIAMACCGCNSKNTLDANISSQTDNTDVNSDDFSSDSDDFESEDDSDIDSDFFEEDEEYEDEYEESEDESEEETEDEDENYIYEIKAKINNVTPLSTKYMGSGSGVYYCYSYMPDSMGVNATDEQIAFEMDRLQNMGVHTVRTMFKFLWVRDEKSATGWNWENDNMKAIYRWLGEMQKRDIDVIINPWNFMWLYNGDASIVDTDYFRTDNFTVNSERWCDAVAELFKQLRARGYNNAKYLMLFTEPIYSRDKSEDIYNCYVENAKRLHTTLVEANLRSSVKIVGPNRSDADTDLLQKCIDEADEAFDVYSQHQYLRARSITNDTYYDDGIAKYKPYVELMQASKAKDKPFWIDEFGIQDASLAYSNVGEDNEIRGVQLAVGITAAMNVGVDNVLVWTFADQKWPNQDNTNNTGGFADGVSIHGMLNDIRFTMVPKTQYYAYSLLSKYCGRSNGKTYLATPYEEYEYWGVTLGCVQTSDGDWTIIVTNTNAEDMRISIDFEKSLGGVKLFRHQYVANEVVKNIAGQIIPANKTFKNVTTVLDDILRPSSVAVYTTIKG
jgi:hypothetical protein